MPQYRMTGLFQFAGPPPAGFSESWDFIATDDTAALQQPSSWAKERVRILSEDWTLTGIRLTRLAPFAGEEGCELHQTLVEGNVCQPPEVGKLGRADSPFAAVYITINTRQSTPSSGFPPRPRRWLVRGIPDAWWDQAALLRDGPIVGAVNRYLNFMITNMQAGSTRIMLGCASLALLPYGSYCIRRVASRRIGRPFGLLRGRRSPIPAVPSPPA